MRRSRSTAFRDPPSTSTLDPLLSSDQLLDLTIFLDLPERFREEPLAPPSSSKGKLQALKSAAVNEINCDLDCRVCEERRLPKEGTDQREEKSECVAEEEDDADADAGEGVLVAVDIGDESGMKDAMEGPTAEAAVSEEFDEPDSGDRVMPLEETVARAPAAVESSEFDDDDEGESSPGGGDESLAGRGEEARGIEGDWLCGWVWWLDW
mmetsp:Transcript_2716/g.8523  ORF Transcript_2716/g.8523 Transcript_2716/m.8523 type:complete len:209 (+) Transcript_2716:1939-2565(+)